MPRSIVPQTYIDDFGVVHIKRSNSWAISYNPALATCIRSNHDISWISTQEKALAFIYYITNYATKADVSPYQILVKAALIADARKIAPSNTTSNSEDNHQTPQDSKFLLRLYNALANDQEISGVQVASTLLDFPSYKNLTKFTYISIWSLRNYIRYLLRIPFPHADEDSIDNPYLLRVQGKPPLDRLQNYELRGQVLQDFCFFEYCMLLQRRAMADATPADCFYDNSRPKYETEVQHLAKSPSQTYTVCRQGQLSAFQNEEEAILRGHPTTPSIRNDLAEILLTCFIPW
jgi:hypothetical protein